MKHIYLRPGKFFRAILLSGILAFSIASSAQSPTLTTHGICTGVIADFNTDDNGFNSPSVYGSVFDSSFYFNPSRGYWTDYLYPQRVTAPGAPRAQNLVSPPYQNPSPSGTFNIGFYYI